jgi:hypothetical protein
LVRRTDEGDLDMNFPGYIRQHLGLVTIYLVLIAVALSPLARVSLPSLVDYPNHLARMWILSHPELPALAANYRPDWRLLPNLALDLVVPGLAHIMSVESAGRLFVAMTLASLVLATAGLRWALHGKVGLWPLLSLLFLYNSALLWGFLNYLFALGIALSAFALWVAAPRWHLGLGLLVFSLLAALLLVLHLFAFAIYGLLIGVYEFGGWWRETPRRLGSFVSRSLGAVQFVPALLLWAMILQGGVTTKIEFGDFGRKFYAWLAPISFGFSPPLLSLIMLVTGLLSFFIARRARVVTLVPAMRWPLAAVALVAVAMPFSLHGSNFADYRLPVALPFLLIAALRVNVVHRRNLAWYGVLAVALFGVRIWATTEIWSQNQRSFDEFRRADTIIPEGARLLAVANKMPSDWRWPGTEGSILPLPDAQVFNHLALLAVIDRSAYVPTFFSTWTVVEPTARNGGRAPSDTSTPRPNELAVESDSSCDPEYLCHWPEKFDYLLWIDYGERPSPLPAHLATVATGSFFTIYRVTPREP